MRYSALIFGLLSALLIGVAISFFFQAASNSGTIVMIFSSLSGLMGIGAAAHTFGRANRIDKPAFESMGYIWPSGILLWTSCIIGAVIVRQAVQGLSGLSYLGLDFATYLVWFLIAMGGLKLGLIPDREEAHKSFYGTGQ